MNDENSSAAQGDDATCNEYIIDDTLDPLQRLVKYIGTDFSLQRLTLVKDVADTAAFCGFQNAVKEILPLVDKFVTDQEPSVRLAFVGQIAPLAKFLVEAGGNDVNDPGYSEMVKHLLPAAVELLADKNVEVGFASLQVMHEIAQLLKPPQVEEQLLQVCMSLSRDDRAEDYRVVAAHLFNDLSSVFGKKLCLETIMPEVLVLSKDSNFCVRRAVASSLSKIAGVIGFEHADDKVLPIFLALARDEVWSVRKACAENIVGVSEHLSPATRVSQVVPVFRLVSEDSSRWVRVAAFQYLGRFLHTLPKADITSVLLKVFTDMAFQSESGEGELAEFCASSFPAVLQTVGAERWREMADAFNALIKDAQWKVRRTVASSLHEFALVLGPEGTEKNLVAAFELFLRDIDDIKHAVIQNADAFIRVLPQEGATREKVIVLMCAVPPESENWRLRDVIAQKLGPIVRLVPQELAFECAGELCCHLLEDSVVDVRISSYHAAASLLVHLETHTESHAAFLQQINAFATRPNFQLRHNFTYVLQQVIEITNGGKTQSVTLEKMLEILPSTVAVDAVSNVRFSAARVLSLAQANYGSSLNGNAKFSAAIKALLMDKDIDVAARMKALVGRTGPFPVGPRAASYRD